MSPPKRSAEEAAPPRIVEEAAPVSTSSAVSGPVSGPVPVPVEDQRQFPRHAIELPASVRDAGNRVEGAIRFDTRDISLGGAFLRSDLLFEVGEELEVDFDLPGASAAIRVKARVVRVARGGAGSKEQAGMGIAFSDLSERDREAMRAALDRP